MCKYYWVLFQSRESIKDKKEKEGIDQKRWGREEKVKNEARWQRNNKEIVAVDRGKCSGKGVLLHKNGEHSYSNITCFLSPKRH